MSKRTLRNSLVLAAVAVLGTAGVASVADAQTVVNPQSTVTVSAKFNGPVPSGVSAVAVTVECQNVVIGAPATLGSQKYTAVVPVSGGTGIMNFNLQTTLPSSGPTPSSCKVNAFIAGSGNVDKGSIGIAVGGTSRGVAQGFITGVSSVNSGANTRSADTTGSLSTTPNTPANAGYLPVFSSTDVVVTVSYPAITVKKVTVGDEPVAGFAYPMSIACNSGTTTGTGFIAGYKGNTGGTNIAIGTADFTVGLPAPLADGYAPANGDLILPGGAGFFVSFGYRDTTVPGDYQYINIYDVRTNPLLIPTQTGNVASFAGVAGNVTAFLNLTASAFSHLTTAQKIAIRDTFLAAIPTSTSGTTVLSPTGTVNGVVVFNGTFALKNGEQKVIGINEFPALTTSSMCEVVETNGQGAVTGYSSTVTNADGTKGAPLGAVQVGTSFRSSLTAANGGETITVTNSFYGDLIVSKVVTGDPKTNIGTFEISVACDKGGPKDTFLLKDRQSKIYNNIAVGTNCLITETRSDGAISSYSDNSGDNPTDGRVTIKARGTGCAQAGAPTNAAPGGPAPTSSFNDCMANVIVTNDYNPPATTAAPAAPATTAAPAAPATTAAPAVTPAPATPVQDVEPTFTG